MWIVFFWSRLFVEKFLCILKMEMLQETIKKITGRHETFITDEFIATRINIKLKELSPLCRQIKSVHEQGTGWHGIDIIVFYLLGVERIYTTDVRDLLKMDIVRKVVSFLVRNSNKYSVYEDKILFLKENIKYDRAQFLSSINTVYCVNDRFDKFRNLNDFYKEGFDMFYSDSVLQRFKISDLREYIVSTLSLSNNESFHYHKVDCKDFFSIRNQKIPQLYYLRVNNFVWETLTCRKLNYQNRLRIFDFVLLFERSLGKTRTRNELVNNE